MIPIPDKVRNIARRLLVYEAAGRYSPEEAPRAVVGVCEKLRIPLSAIAGAEGYRALILRALALAKNDVPSLGQAHVKEDGELVWPLEPGREMAGNEEAGTELVAQLIWLLVTFIGENLTLRLVCDAWPDAVLDGVNPETEKEI